MLFFHTISPMFFIGIVCKVWTYNGSYLAIIFPFCLYTTWRISALFYMSKHPFWRAKTPYPHFVFSKNPPIKKWGSKSNFFTDYFIWLYHNFSLPCPCYILCTLFLSSKWILEAVSASNHQAWFLLPDQISFLITAASFFVLFSFFRTDFFCKNSAASSQQHFFLPIRFLFPGQIPFCKLAALFCNMISFFPSDFLPQNSPSRFRSAFFSHVRFHAAN